MTSLAADALRRSLYARIADERRSEDELRVLDDVLAGIERGADVYGPMDLAKDRRNFMDERSQEYRDALIYTSMMAVAAAHHARELLSGSYVVESSEPQAASPARVASEHAPAVEGQSRQPLCGCAECMAPARVEIEIADERIALVEIE